MTERAQCPYREDCWLDAFCGGWQSPNGPRLHPLGFSCGYEDRCDTDTCPRYQKMEAEKAEREKEPQR